MPLQSHRKLFSKPNKPAQYAAAFIALAVVISLVFLWATLHRDYTNAQNTSSDNTSSPVQEPLFTADDTKLLLCIITGKTDTHFYIIQSNPQHEKIHVMAIPSPLFVNETDTLHSFYGKNGVIKTTARLADVLRLSLQYYVVLTPENAVKWLSRAQNGIPVNLTKEITYTQDNTITTVIPAGKFSATSTQAAVLLQADDEAGVDVITSLINTYMRGNRHLSSDFSALCNVAQTNLRIDNFTAYRTALTHLTAINNGRLAQHLTLPTDTADNRLVIDNRALNKLALYQ